MSEIIDLELNKIRTDGGTQSRASMDNQVVNEYTTLIEESMADFPPVVVFYDGTDYWLADGFHRHLAHTMAFRATLKTIKAEVRQGTQRDAILHSVGANSNHGLRRTSWDKRRAIEKLLYDDEWCQWSDREIAKRCGVSPSTVGSVRKEVEASLGPTVQIGQLDKRIGADGKSRKLPDRKPKFEVGAKVALFKYGYKGQIGTVLEVNTANRGALIQYDGMESWFNETQLSEVPEHIAKFPLETPVMHRQSKRIGTVVGHDKQSVSIIESVSGLKELWMADSIRAATDDELELYKKGLSWRLQQLIEKFNATPDTPWMHSTTDLGFPDVDLKAQISWERIERHPNGGGYIRITEKGLAYYSDKLQKPAFNEGDTVTTKSGHAGVVVSTNNSYVEVETTNGTRAYKPDNIAAAEPFVSDDEQNEISQSVDDLEQVLDALKFADTMMCELSNEDQSLWELHKQLYRVINAVENHQNDLLYKTSVHDVVAAK